jgi:hypothetical protein
MKVLIAVALIALAFAADKAAPATTVATPVTTGQQGWGRPAAWNGVGHQNWAQPAWEGNWGHHQQWAQPAHQQWAQPQQAHHWGGQPSWNNNNRGGMGEGNDIMNLLMMQMLMN